MTKKNEFQNHILKKRTGETLPWSTIYVLVQIKMSFFALVFSKFVLKFDRYSNGYNPEKENFMFESLEKHFPTIYAERNS